MTTEHALHRLPLSQRELEILRLTAEGLPSKEIGRALGIEEATVKVHRKGLMRKIGARNAPHAVAIALRTGLMPLEGA